MSVLHLLLDHKIEEMAHKIGGQNRDLVSSAEGVLRKDLADFRELLLGFDSQHHSKKRTKKRLKQLRAEARRL